MGGRTANHKPRRHRDVTARSWKADSNSLVFTIVEFGVRLFEDRGSSSATYHRQPWHNNTTKKLRQVSRVAERCWKKTHLQDDFTALKQATLAFKSALTSAKQAYYTTLVSSLSYNPKQLFKTFNRCWGVMKKQEGGVARRWEAPDPDLQHPLDQIAPLAPSVSSRRLSALTDQAEGATRTICVIAPSDLNSQSKRTRRQSGTGKMERRPACGTRTADYSRDHGGPEGMDPDGVIERNWIEIVDNFDDMNLKESLLRAIYAYGYDVIAQAQSGSGKTATFAISILQQLEIELQETHALVLAPTRSGSTDPKGHSWPGCNMPCLHWRHTCSQ
ncbi:unnamed protein product [Ranitomeya imitator]|uniref:DEAD/DEAH-box helicase domain-containing protein n=1 Tax=Ranitomeya imitator TaxID=111125 RepID=A0ABN9LB22_9NEOB|nr:unnamed protein product [Ranitomeya imitator]